MRALTLKTLRTTPARNPLLALLAATAFALLQAIALPAAAQNPFSPAILVDEQAITFYEIDQRVRLLEAFTTPGDLRALAREQLVDDRLKLDALRRAGLQLSDEALQSELEAFAGRANLTLAQLTAQLGQAGADQAALRDFVRVGVSWRDFVRQRFGRQVQISEADIDAALARPAGGGTGIEILLNEIIIAAPPPQAAAAQAEAERIAQLTSTAAFEDAARRVSALPSREQGGRMDWVPIGNFPAGLHPLFLGLAPGEVTPPIPITNGIALFQLRAIRETAQSTAAPAEIDYAAFYIPGGRSPEALDEAARVAAATDTCDDLYGVAQGLPAERLQRQTLAPAQIPQDVALELARLDPGEVSATLTDAGGSNLILLMLCSRSALPAAEVDRSAVRNALTTQRLAGYGDAHLADLRAAANIRTP